MKRVVVALGLVACGAKENPVVQQARGSAEPRVAAEVLVSDAGVGRIGLGLRVEEDATVPFGERMPGWTFAEERDTGEDHDVSVVTGTHEGRAGLRIVLNRYMDTQPVVSVSASDPMFMTAKRLAAGMTVGDAADAYPMLECRLEVYAPGADVLGVERRCFCMAPELTQVTFALTPADCLSDGKAQVTLIVPEAIAAKAITALEWIPTEP